MQILQWLLTNTRSKSRREQCNVTRDEIQVLKPRELADDGEAKKKSTFTILLKGENGRKIFYSLLHLRSPRMLYKRNKTSDTPESMIVDCKAFPTCEAISIEFDGGDSDDIIEKDRRKCDGRRASTSRMKELVRWAAAAKIKGVGSKGIWKVSYFGSRGDYKDSLGNSCSDSRRMNFEVGSRSASSSMYYSPISPAGKSAIINQTSRKRLANPEANAPSSPKSEECIRNTTHWITTDDQFVVLELDMKK